MRFIKRLMEIKERQLNNEIYQNMLLEKILEVLKGGLENGKSNKVCRRSTHRKRS